MLVAGLERLPNIDFVEVVTTGGVTLAQAGVRPSEDDLIGRVYLLTRDYHNRPIALGQLTVAASHTSIRDLAWTRLWPVVGATGLLVLLLSAALYGMVHRLVTSRLALVTKYARRIGQDGPTGISPLAMDLGRTTDEFGYLAQVLNDMNAALADSYYTIRDSETRYRDLFTNSPVALWEEDFSEAAAALRDLGRRVPDLAAHLEDSPDTVRALAARVTIIDVNEAALILHRATDKAELTGRLTTCFTPSSFDAFRRELVAIWHEEWELSMDSEIRTLDGDVREVVVRWFVPPDHRRALTRVVVSIEDVTERRQSERALGITLEKLMQANGELERLTFGASHDLQEPVRTVVSFSQLLERNLRAAERTDPETLEILGFIKEAALRMRHQVAGLLDYARVGQPGRAFRPVALAEIVEIVRVRLSEVLDDIGATIEIGELPIVTGDSDQLGELFHQLFDNTIKFRRASPPDLKVTVSAERMSHEWVFTVSDNGIGIDLDYASDIFQAFRRLHGPTQYPGAGMGLALCRRIVERHGGRIWVEASADPGAIVKFTLPDRRNS